MDVIKNNDKLVAVKVPLTECYAQLNPMQGSSLSTDDTHADFRIWKNGYVNGTLTINYEQARELQEAFGVIADWLMPN